MLHNSNHSHNHTNKIVNISTTTRNATLDRSICFSRKIGRRAARSARSAPPAPTGPSCAAATLTGRRGGRSASCAPANQVKCPKYNSLSSHLSQGAQNCIAIYKVKVQERTSVFQPLLSCTWSYLNDYRCSFWAMPLLIRSPWKFAANSAHRRLRYHLHSKHDLTVIQE